MYFPRQNILLERLPDGTPLLSLADSVSGAAFLALAKRHCALPVDATVTEFDLQVAMYVDAAEKFIDAHSNCPFRPHQFRLNLSGLNCHPEGSAERSVDAFGRPFKSIRLPFGPVTATPVITNTADDGTVTTFASPTDFTFWGGYSLKPEIVFNTLLTWPTSDITPYPYRVTFTTANNASDPCQKLAIMMLTGYYFRNPEGMGDEVPDVGSAFWAMVNSLKRGLL